MTSSAEIACFFPSSKSSKSPAVNPVTGRPSLPTTVTGISITVAPAVSRTLVDGGAWAAAGDAAHASAATRPTMRRRARPEVVHSGLPAAQYLPRAACGPRPADERAEGRAGRREARDESRRRGSDVV